jgi:putative ABC transport system permease protein
VKGIQSLTYCDWFGGRWAAQPHEFFANMACADNAFDVYPEIVLDPAALMRWQHDKQGAIVGDMLAKKLGWHVGDHMTLQGSFYPGIWELTIDGIYSASPQSALDRSTFFFHWDYKNERVAERQQNQIGWIFTRVEDPARGPAVSRAIDALFDARDVQTATMSERAANSSLLGTVSAILSALELVSLIVLAITTLIIANTLAMSVRERTSEYAVLRVLGFQPPVLRRLIIAEALAIAVSGALLGLLAAYPLVELAMGRWLEENMGKFFPVFRITLLSQLIAIAASLTMGVVAAWLPAFRVGRMQVADALRRVE